MLYMDAMARSSEISEIMSWAEMLEVSGGWTTPEKHDVGQDVEEQEEEVASPQLWDKHRNPDGVTEEQLMTRYRKQMMELVGDAPENAFELSLRDIVDVTWKEKNDKNENESSKDLVDKKRNKGMKGRVARSGNLGNGLLLKMFVPGNTARSSFSVSGAQSKVVPRTMVAKGEWWRRKELGKSSSIDLNNSINHTGWRKMSGCLPLLHKAMKK
ncbi:hypothetical protein DsansV1_C19g0157431 [Dioscorea sansibarensis]